MNELTIKSRNRLNQGELVSQELNSTREGFRRWIAIYPLKDEQIRKRYEGFKFKIIDFELDIKLVNEFFGEHDKVNLKEYLVTSDVELFKLFLEMDVNPQRFDAPWNNDFPL